MGHWKRVAEDEAEDYQTALRLLIEVEAIDECENHDGTYFNGGAAVEDAYKLFNARVSSGQITLAEGDSRSRWTDLLKSVYEDNSASGSCAQCDDNFGRD